MSPFAQFKSYRLISTVVAVLLMSGCVSESEYLKRSRVDIRITENELAGLTIETLPADMTPLTLIQSSDKTFLSSISTTFTGCLNSFGFAGFLFCPPIAVIGGPLFYFGRKDEIPLPQQTVLDANQKMAELWQAKKINETFTAQVQRQIVKKVIPTEAAASVSSMEFQLKSISFVRRYRKNVLNLRVMGCLTFINQLEEDRSPVKRCHSIHGDDISIDNIDLSDEFMNNYLTDSMAQLVAMLLGARYDHWREAVE